MLSRKVDGKAPLIHNLVPVNGTHCYECRGMLLSFYYHPSRTLVTWRLLIDRVLSLPLTCPLAWHNIRVPFKFTFNSLSLSGVERTGGPWPSVSLAENEMQGCHNCNNGAGKMTCAFECYHVSLESLSELNGFSVPCNLGFHCFAEAKQSDFMILEWPIQSHIGANPFEIHRWTKWKVWINSLQFFSFHTHSIP